jgi:hypothetical protein
MNFHAETINVTGTGTLSGIKYFLGAIQNGTAAATIYKGSAATAANKIAALGTTAGVSVMPSFPVDTSVREGTPLADTNKLHVVVTTGDVTLLVSKS